MSDDSRNNEIREESGGDENFNKGFLFLVIGILAIVFSIGIIFAFIYRWAILVKGRQRFSVTLAITAVLNLIIYGLWKATDASGMLMEFLNNLGNISNNWPSLIWPLLLVNLSLGSLFGLVWIGANVRTLKTTPHLKKIEGEWSYNFSYRRTPIEWLMFKKKKNKLKNGEYSSSKKAPVGIDLSCDRPAYRFYSESILHSMIVGGSGSGKTVTMLSQIYNDIRQGKACVVIDFKRDPKLASRISKWCDDAGRPLYHFASGKPKDYDIPFNPIGQSKYDPLQSGTPGEKADMVLSMREYDTAAAVYKSAMQDLLQVLFAALDDADRKKAPNIRWNDGGIFQIASVIDGDNLTELAIACEGTPSQKNIEELAAVVKSRGSSTRHAFDELKGQMRTIIASEFGRWMKIDENSNKKSINIFEMTNDANYPDGKLPVILFSFNSESEPEFSSYVGSMVMSDLSIVSARRRNKGLSNYVMVYADEFQAVPPSAVVGLLEKSRASYMAITLSLQSFSQIIKAAPSNGEAYLDSMLDTCSNFFIHAGATYSNAERLSGIIGKDDITIYRSSSKNENFLFSWNWSNRRKQQVQKDTRHDWVIPPKDFMSLTMPSESNNGKTTAMILNKSIQDPAYTKKKTNSSSHTRLTLMIPDVEVLEDYYSFNKNTSNESSKNKESSENEEKSLRIISKTSESTNENNSVDENSEESIKSENNSPESTVIKKNTSPIIEDGLVEDEDFTFENIEEDDDFDLPDLSDESIKDDSKKKDNKEFVNPFSDEDFDIFGGGFSFDNGSSGGSSNENSSYGSSTRHQNDSSGNFIPKDF